ncbi:hypothetical protein HPB51_021061 [Rhipicephalus microplus]|uniref:Uncharacterized protein n=1 Tax=Rhipicephalus microplus TaxID=6941 RepID=A0A9J6ECT3_RHIMP|nr:hypothetical protein HPB51_021061 [Rhipicephalus microplus]
METWTDNIVFWQDGGKCYPGSSSSLSTDSLDLTQSDDDAVNEEDVVKFMIFVLLMLNRRRSKNRGYDEQLLRTGFFTPSAPSSVKRTASQEPERYVACGQSHCGLVVRGKAYTWGRAQFGRLGHRESHKEILGVTCVEVLDNLRVKVTQVACGTHHTLFNTDAGVFSCGSSRYGQLGLGNVQRTWVPHLVDTLAGREVAKVATGLYHSLAVTKDGRWDGRTHVYRMPAERLMRSFRPKDRKNLQEQKCFELHVGKRAGSNSGKRAGFIQK